ncbi:hypothetical protein AZI86_09760 [Bdellovibrio bacteriovorus]|uniref:Uncharacterized protein n=1 Tax=Bdellovibrio bacteriovorus TaxID=959 RepID=A0A150WSG8_BDEBC|nr:hypothetical protein [Bdellovibrio bacteriovorus]KYG67277.1 hypothetical protein AZI86_09760 [Bdellovibrio bacteriovorus]
MAKKQNQKKWLHSPLFRTLVFAVTTIGIALLVGVTVNQTTDKNGTEWNKLLSLWSFWLLIILIPIAFWYYYKIEDADRRLKSLVGDIQLELSDVIVQRYKDLVAAGKYDDELVDSSVIKDIIK